jgi:hypothetical protein
MCFPLMVTERFCFEWRPAPPSHRGGGNGGATAAPWPSLLSAAGDPGAFRPQRKPAKRRNLGRRVQPVQGVANGFCALCNYVPAPPLPHCMRRGFRRKRIQPANCPIQAAVLREIGMNSLFLL